MEGLAEPWLLTLLLTKYLLQAHSSCEKSAPHQENWLYAREPSLFGRWGQITLSMETWGWGGVCNQESQSQWVGLEAQSMTRS